MTASAAVVVVVSATITERKPVVWLVFIVSFFGDHVTLFVPQANGYAVGASVVVVVVPAMVVVMPAMVVVMMSVAVVVMVSATVTPSNPKWIAL